MATWTTITDAALEPGKPIRSVDGLALRDNVTALAEGAAGAPGIARAALIDWPWGNEDIRNSTLGAEKFQTGTTERDWVLGRTSDAAGGAVGTYAFAEADAGAASAFGDSISGSRLTPSNVAVFSTWSVSGTWRCMGSTSGDSGANSTTLWLRIS
jgi:hypothetical protein